KEIVMKKLLLIMMCIITSCTVKPIHKVVYPQQAELKKGLDLALEKLNLQNKSFKQFQAQYSKDVTEIRQEYILALDDIKHYIDIKFDETKQDLEVKTISISNLIKETGENIILQNEESTEDITDQIKESIELQKKNQYEVVQYINGVIANQNNENQQLFSLIAEIREGVFKIIEVYNHENDNTYHLKMNNGQFKKFLEDWLEWNHINKD
ncbi:MAG: hypothetical protein ACRC0A_07655, partial [Chitinophagaceae bacterium]